MIRLILSICLLSGLPATVSATQWQSLDEIRNVAEAYAVRSHGTGSARTVEAGLLDSRLHLKDCSGKLAAFTAPGSRPGSNMTVGIRCNGPAPWKIYVPVRSRLVGQVLVSRNALQRGHKLTLDDVVLSEHDLDRLHYGYLQDPADLVGQELRRAIPPGAVITPPMLAQSRTVRRGQTVTLYADQGGIEIKMAGKALMDAALQQRIRVENLSSGRIIEGVVRSPERVEILLN